MQMQTMQSHGALVMPNFSTYSGRKKLEAADLHLPAGTELPPEEVASLGSRKLVDQKVIRHLAQPRDKAHAACQKVGTKFRRGVYFVPKDKLDDLCAELDVQVAEHRTRAADFKTKVATLVDDFATEHPRWADAIRRGAPAGDELSLHADYLVLPFNTVDGHSDVHLEASAAKLSSTLFDEIAADAKKFVDDAVKRPADDGLSQRALSPFRRICDKLEGLAFLDSRIRPIIDNIQKVLLTMPSSGRIQGPEYVALWSLARMMTDPANLVTLSQLLPVVDQGYFDSRPVLVEPASPGKDDVATDATTDQDSVDASTAEPRDDENVTNAETAAPVASLTADDPATDASAPETTTPQDSVPAETAESPDEGVVIEPDETTEQANDRMIVILPGEKSTAPPLPAAVGSDWF